jgi:hypothetical protein
MLPVSSFLLFIAVLLNMGGGSGGGSLKDSSGADYRLGVIVVSAASVISGLSSALTQRALVGSKSVRSPLFLSAELAVYGILVLLINILVNNEFGNEVAKLPHWSYWTLIPVVTNVRLPFGVFRCIFSILPFSFFLSFFLFSLVCSVQL